MEACTIIDLVASPSPRRKTSFNARINKRYTANNALRNTKKRKAAAAGLKGLARGRPSTIKKNLKKKVQGRGAKVKPKPIQKRTIPNVLQKKMKQQRRQAKKALKRKQPPPGASKSKKKQAASKKRKLNNDSQPLTLKPPQPYDENLELKKTTLAELPKLGWLPMANPCAVIKEELEQKPDEVALVVFVDLDNVGCCWIKAHRKIPSNVLVWGFCGGGYNLGIKLQQFHKHYFTDNRIFITICGGGTNSADFGLTYYAGELNHVLPKHIPFAITSNDNDLRHLLGHLKMGRPRAIIVNVTTFASSTFKSLHFLLFRCKRILNEQWPGEDWDTFDDGQAPEEGKGITSGMYDILKNLEDTEIASLLEQLEEGATKRRPRKKPNEGSQDKVKEPIVIDLDEEDDAEAAVTEGEKGVEKEKEAEETEEVNDDVVLEKEVVKKVLRPRKGLRRLLRQKVDIARRKKQQQINKARRKSVSETTPNNDNNNNTTTTRRVIVPVAPVVIDLTDD